MPRQIVHGRPGGKLCVGPSAPHASLRTPEALHIVAGAATQTLRRRQMRQVELRCVLNRQHDRHLPHAIERLRNVGREDAVRVDLRIIEETISSLQFGRLERLWKRTLRTARESARQRNKTLRQARITQISLAKFGTCPVICVVLVDQSRLPLRTEWAKVSIDADSLQATITTLLSRCG